MFQVVTKRTWDTKEISAVYSAFGNIIRENSRKILPDWSLLPSKSQAEKVVTTKKLDRSWKNVKDFVRNEIIRLRRIQKKDPIRKTKPRKSKP